MTIRNTFAMLLMAVLSFSLIACNEPKETSQGREAALTEENQQRLLKATPPPALENSLEREQLKRRLIRFNNKNKVSYITLISFGKVMATMAIRGKVSSVNSLLTTPDQIVLRGSGNEEGVRSRHVVASPDLDGSYGSNGDAVFFFRSSDDAYMEWNDKYLLSDAPISLTTPPTFTIDETDK